MSVGFRHVVKGERVVSLQFPGCVGYFDGGKRGKHGDVIRKTKEHGNPNENVPTPRL